MTVIYYMSIDRADKPWIGDRRLTARERRRRGGGARRRRLLTHGNAAIQL